MNLKNEFGINKLCRLEPEKTSWEQEQDMLTDTRKKKLHESNIKNFVSVIKNVIKIEITITATNPNFTCRKIEEDQRKRKEFTSSSVWQQTVPTKKKKMDHSTPKEKPRAN